MKGAVIKSEEELNHLRGFFAQLKKVLRHVGGSYLDIVNLRLDSFSDDIVS